MERTLAVSSDTEEVASGPSQLDLQMEWYNKKYRQLIGEHYPYNHNKTEISSLRQYGSISNKLRKELDRRANPEIMKRPYVPVAKRKELFKGKEEYLGALVIKVMDDNGYRIPRSGDIGSALLPIIQDICCGTNVYEQVQPEDYYTVRAEIDMRWNKAVAAMEALQLSIMTGEKIDYIKRLREIEEGEW